MAVPGSPCVFSQEEMSSFCAAQTRVVGSVKAGGSWKSRRVSDVHAELELLNYTEQPLYMELVESECTPHDAELDEHPFMSNDKIGAVPVAPYVRPWLPRLADRLHGHVCRDTPLLTKMNTHGSMLQPVASDGAPRADNGSCSQQGPELVMELINAFRRSQAMFAAVQLRLFDALLELGAVAMPQAPVGGATATATEAPTVCRREESIDANAPSSTCHSGIQQHASSATLSPEPQHGATAEQLRQALADMGEVVSADGLARLLCCLVPMGLLQVGKLTEVPCTCTTTRHEHA